jgi:amidase
MAFHVPTAEQIKALAADMGMELTDDYAQSMRAFLAPFAEGYRLVEQLPDCVPEVKYPRTPGYRPEGEENRYGAWLVKTHIKGAKSGKLAGKRVAIKDTYCIAGVPLTNGATVLEGYVPNMDATVVTRLLDAGAEIVGKSVCEYFSFSGGAATSSTGPVHNPRAWGHTPGGSSTGSGALVALGEVDMATGGDQAGSIRIPASFSGVVGIKPTHGLVPYTGIMGMEASIDHAGPLTATAADNALFLEAMAGEDGFDARQRNVKTEAYTRAVGQSVRGMSIAVVKEGFGQPDSHPDVDAGVRAAAKELAGLGAKVTEVSIPWHHYGLPLWSAICIEGAYETAVHGGTLGRNAEGLYPVSLAAFAGTIKARANELPDTVKTGMVLGAYTAQHFQGLFYYKAQNLRRRLRAEYDKVLADHDLLLMPTTRMMASKIPPPDAPYGDVMRHSWEMIGNTCPFNVSGHPAISIPCGLGEGNRPIGLMLVAKHWQESTLYRAADAFEKAVDWQKAGPARAGKK